MGVTRPSASRRRGWRGSKRVRWLPKESIPARQPPGSLFCIRECLSCRLWRLVRIRDLEPRAWTAEGAGADRAAQGDDYRRDVPHVAEPVVPQRHGWEGAGQQPGRRAGHLGIAQAQGGPHSPSAHGGPASAPAQGQCLRRACRYGDGPRDVGTAADAQAKQRRRRVDRLRWLARRCPARPRMGISININQYLNRIFSIFGAHCPFIHEASHF